MHTLLASGLEQVGDANRCCKDSTASFSSLTKMCSLLLQRMKVLFSIALTVPFLKLNQILLLIEASGRKEKGGKIGR